MYTELGHAITLIDSGLIKEGFVACYLLESDGETAIIETGNAHTVARILQLLEDKGLSINDVKYVIPTHVHLDHAGGASPLIQNLPNAQLVIHPRGAKHMIDPTVLIAGAKDVYGEDNFNEMYPNIKPIPASRVIVAEDGDSLTIGRRILEFRDTPGHASHHFCIWDVQSQGWFTGDTFGVTYPALSLKDNKTDELSHYIMPTSSPVQFKPELMKKSIDLMMAYSPRYLYLTHYGKISANRRIASELCQQVDGYVDLVNSLCADQTSDQINSVTVNQLKDLMLPFCYEKAKSFGLEMPIDEFKHIIKMDLELNCQGLLIWFNRVNKTLKS